VTGNMLLLSLIVVTQICVMLGIGVAFELGEANFGNGYGTQHVVGKFLKNVG